MTASSLSSQRSGVIAPYGGTLVDLMVSATEHAALKASATTSIECSDRNACDVELLVVGGFSPERGFMHQADYDSVVGVARLEKYKNHPVWEARTWPFPYEMIEGDSPQDRENKADHQNLFR